MQDADNPHAHAVLGSGHTDGLSIHPSSAARTRAPGHGTPYQYQSGMHAQVAYTQQTLVSDVPAFVRLVRASLGPGSGTIVIDGYHAFGALPTVQRLAGAGFESRGFDCPSLARTKGIGHKGMTCRVDRVWY
jgi:hypothetical protein